MRKLCSALMGWMVGLCLLVCVMALDYHLFNEEKQMGKYTKWWLIAIGMVALFSFLAGCATTRYVPVVTFSPDNSGGTTCDQKGRPVIVINNNVPVEQMYFVRIHENEHIRQIRAFGSCQEFMERYASDPVFRFEAEGEAYCVSYRAALTAGFTPTIESLVSFMQMKYAPRLSLEEVRSRLPCGGGNDPP